jgi:[NiFe] hydrogenase assembly HybE family chaperone
MSDDINNHPRAQALVDMFRRVDASMRDLPIYNNKVAIEAIGFRIFGADALIGVVLTPWFMNLTLLPIQPTPLDNTAIGKIVTIELPAGPRRFATNGDAEVGLYQAHSLHSPVLSFTLPEQARAEAVRQLGLLMSPPPDEPAASNALPASDVNRRSLLFGRRTT